MKNLDTLKKWSETLHWLLCIMFFITGIMAAWEKDGSPLSDALNPVLTVYLAALFILTKYAYIEGRHDALKYPKKINYPLSNIARGITAVALYFIFNFHGIFGWFTGAFIMGSILCGFGIVFDVRYNLTREKFAHKKGDIKWNYVGEISWLDQFLGDLKFPVFALVFILGFITIWL